MTFQTQLLTFSQKHFLWLIFTTPLVVTFPQYHWWWLVPTTPLAMTYSHSMASTYITTCYDLSPQCYRFCFVPTSPSVMASPYITTGYDLSPQCYQFCFVPTSPSVMAGTYITTCYDLSPRNNGLWLVPTSSLVMICTYHWWLVPTAPLDEPQQGGQLLRLLGPHPVLHPQAEALQRRCVHHRTDSPGHPAQNAQRRPAGVLHLQVLQKTPQGAAPDHRRSQPHALPRWVSSLSVVYRAVSQSVS